MKLRKIMASFLICAVFVFCQTQEAKTVFNNEEYVNTLAEIEEGQVILGGQTVGVALYLEGLFVSDISAVERADGTFITPALEAGIKRNDSILTANGVELNDISNLDAVIDASKGNKIELNVKRGYSTFTTFITPVYNGEAYRLGLYLKDSAAGLGTVTYIDAQTKKYAALGHAICDNDSGAMYSVGKGRLVECNITGVQKAQKNKAGELKGTFGINAAILGTVESNTRFGLTGEYSGTIKNEQIVSVCEKEDVHEGQATIYSDFENGEIKGYNAEIIHINKQTAPTEKSFIFRVTDENLIEITGGIVQGLSGSPIVQDGNLIGAVTHVMISDPLMGYGLYIEWMM